MATDTTTDPTYRVYETCQIIWDRGSRWTGYDRARAIETLDHATKCGSGGHIIAKAWALEVDAAKAHIYRPGIDGVEYATQAEAEAVAEARTGRVNA